MAQFRARIKGQRGEASRLGSKSSGIWGQVNAWNLGVEVYARHNKETGEDIFTVYKTEGSGYNQGRQKIIAQFSKFE